MPRLCLIHLRKIVNMIVPIVHVEVGETGIAVQHGTVISVDTDDAAARKRAAQALHLEIIVSDVLNEARITG